MGVFADRGYEGASLAAVAAVAGLSQPGLLHHFPSKRALLLAVLERRDLADADAYGLSGAQGLAALDALAALVRANQARRGLVQAFSVLSGEAAAQRHHGRDWFGARYDRIRTDLAQALAGQQDPPLAAGVVPLEVASEVFAVMDGLQLQWLHDPATVDMAALFEAYVARLKRELVTR